MTDLTRAQVEQMAERLCAMFYREDARVFLEHDALQRARLEASEKAAYDVAGTIEHLKVKLEAVEKERNKYKLESLIKFDCQVCSGALEGENERLTARVRELEAIQQSEEGAYEGTISELIGERDTLTTHCERLEEVVKEGLQLAQFLQEHYYNDYAVLPFGAVETFEAALTPTTPAGDQCSVSIAHPAHDWCKGIPFAPAAEEEG